ncbi:Endo-1,4-beta-xylanase A [Hypsizygus marmoreus]|uniref:Endo-1,4-beta-xylanase A n=1 Tax=Hypsizygus marmoreus TaxID=39966 RepID=A0A369K5Y4_HYPMA|nr:Endo-1,4-beta-xylanase A [Hypsizygus marmoreus]
MDRPPWPTMISALLLVLTAPALLVSAARQITITNKCPSTITIYRNGNSQGSLSSGSSSTSSVSNNFNGFYYTNANGGSSSGADTTRAGFYGQSGYYYLVTDPNGFNTAVTITPRRSRSGGFCVPASCSSLTCSTAYMSPPTSFPQPSNIPPRVPLYSCPSSNNNVGYTITFCPNGNFPPKPPVSTTEIHPNGNTKKCLDIRGAKYANGTPVQIYDCNGTGAQKWQIQDGSTTVRAGNTNFCLDAGSNPANGIKMKIWTCYKGVAAQSWDYTNSNQIRLAGQGQNQCLDLTGGSTQNGNQLQTWQCSNGNNNQIWTD